MWYSPESKSTNYIPERWVLIETVLLLGMVKKKTNFRNTVLFLEEGERR